VSSIRTPKGAGSGGSGGAGGAGAAAVESMMQRWRVVAAVVGRVLYDSALVVFCQP
jgi:hypothetical protein